MENTPKNFDYQVLGKHMCEARKKCNLTQAQMAEILGVSTHYYSSLEREKEYISFPRFAQFLTISKASANELLAGCQEGIMGACKPSPDWGKKRQAMEKLLDRSSEATTGVYVEMCSVLEPHLK